MVKSTPQDTQCDDHRIFIMGRFCCCIDSCLYHKKTWLAGMTMMGSIWEHLILMTWICKAGKCTTSCFLMWYGNGHVPYHLSEISGIYCKTLNFRDTKTSRIRPLGHFWTTNTTILLYRGGSQLSASF